MRMAEFVCALAVLAWAGLLLREATRLHIGWEASGPGAGFFPFWLAVGLALAGLVLLVQVVCGVTPASRDGRPFIEAAAWGSLLKVALPLAGAIVVMQLVGFYVAAALYLVVSTRWLRRHSWPVAVGVSVAFPLMTWLVFERWFLIPLPKGYLGGDLPF